MIGPTKLSEIRAQVRKSFKMTDAELLAWFNRQIESAEQAPKADGTAAKTLRLLRDALVKEAKRGTSRRKSQPATGRRKP